MKSTKEKDEIIVARNEVVFHKEENEKLVAELINARKELAFQKEEIRKRFAELGIANTELAFQDVEKGKRAEELIVAKEEIAVQAELLIANIKALKLTRALEINQIELEKQNIKLIEAKKMADFAAKKYTELYDFAPSGYLTLSKEGEITELNICASQMLGKEKESLVSTKN